MHSIDKLAQGLLIISASDGEAVQGTMKKVLFLQIIIFKVAPWLLWLLILIIAYL